MFWMAGLARPSHEKMQMLKDLISLKKKDRRWHDFQFQLTNCHVLDLF